jgi:hypothetical protein
LLLAGYGGLLDMFVGQPSGSSIISLHDVQRLRIACTAAAANAEVVKQTPRSKHVPGADRPQVPGVGDVTWNVSNAGARPVHGLSNWLPQVECICLVDSQYMCLTHLCTDGSKQHVLAAARFTLG